MTPDSWPLLFGIAFQALLLHAMPRFSRPGILFAVTVPDAFVSDNGRRLVSRYRAIVWSGAALSIAVALFPMPASGSAVQGFLYMAGVVGNLIVGASAWLWAHRRARAVATPHSEVRVASLVPRDTSLPGGSLFASGPFLILLIAALLMVTHQTQLPEDLVITGALRPLALGALYVVIMLTIAMSLSRGTRQIAVEGMAMALEQRFRRLNVLVLELAAYGAAMMLSTVTLKAIPAFDVSANLALLLLPLMLFNFGVAFWMFRVGQGGSRALGATAQQDTSGDGTPDEAWKVGGLLYYNPNDPAVWVENRVGVGYTLNLGNSRAWLLIGMTLPPIIAAPLLFS